MSPREQWWARMVGLVLTIAGALVVGFAGWPDPVPWTAIGGLVLATGGSGLRWEAKGYARGLADQKRAILELLAPPGREVSIGYTDGEGDR